ncbi:phage antirepressor KilAC domain-containing protein [Candidatus Pacearchaeota archaeon]|nr:phage antirepressor KilAC domain-containing protein [Candidatus Pacearchaeota archaeon]
MDNLELSKILEQSAVTISRLTSAIAELQPNAEFGLAVKNGDEHYTMKEAADILSEKIKKEYGEDVGRTGLFKIMRSVGIFSSSGSSYNQPIHQYITDGYFVVKLSNTPVGMKATTKVTGRGMEYIMKKLKEYYHG